MWLSVLGLSGKSPDVDPLVQLFLLASHVNNEISMTTTSIDYSSLSVQDIDRIQYLCHQFTLLACQLFDVPVNTKEHRLLHHVNSHLIDFGLILFGDTRLNESLHR